MIHLPQIKARVARLAELTRGLAKEVSAWKAVESPLSPLERRQYLGRLQDALAGLDAVRVELAGVAQPDGRCEGRPPLAHACIPPQTCTGRAWA